MVPCNYFFLKFQTISQGFSLSNEPVCRLLSNQFNHLQSNKLENCFWLSHHNVPSIDHPFLDSSEEEPPAETATVNCKLMCKMKRTPLSWGLKPMFICQPTQLFLNAWYNFSYHLKGSPGIVSWLVKANSHVMLTETPGAECWADTEQTN